MAGKMSPKFITLCSLAVGAIYSTGYSITTSHNTAAAAPAVQSQASAPSASGTKQTSGNGSNAGSSSAGTSSHKNGGDKSSKSQSDNKQSTSTSNTGNKNTSSANKASSSPSKSSKKKTNTSAMYLDGTYNGRAANRIGAVAVAVSIKQGKIANVQITQCDTHYPERYINPVLPNYVVAHQTTRIPIVSGATLSTRDFYFAVVQALSQAKNPNYKG